MTLKHHGNGLDDLRGHCGIQQLLPHCEGVEVDQENSDLVAALDKLYAIIAKYNPKNVNNLFFLFYLYIYPPDLQESDGGANT